MLQPTMASLGYVDEVVRAAGRQASRDLLRSAPPMAVGARLAGSFRSIPPERRGYALLASTMLVAVGVVGALLLLT